MALVDLPDGLRAVLATDGENVVILIDRHLHPAEREAALAHELVHLERGGSGWTPGLPEALGVVVRREERRVDDLSADRILPLPRLTTFCHQRAEVESITAALVADELEVAESVAERQLRRLSASGP